MKDVAVMTEPLHIDDAQIKHAKIPNSHKCKRPKLSQLARISYPGSNSSTGWSETDSVFHSGASIDSSKVKARRDSRVGSQEFQEITHDHCLLKGSRTNDANKSSPRQIFQKKVTSSKTNKQYRCTSSTSSRKVSQKRRRQITQTSVDTCCKETPRLSSATQAFRPHIRFSVDADVSPDKSCFCKYSKFPSTIPKSSDLVNESVADGEKQKHDEGNAIFTSSTPLLLPDDKINFPHIANVL